MLLKIRFDSYSLEQVSFQKKRGEMLDLLNFIGLGFLLFCFVQFLKAISVLLIHETKCTKIFISFASIPLEKLNKITVLVSSIKNLLRTSHLLKVILLSLALWLLS